MTYLLKIGGAAAVDVLHQVLLVYLLMTRQHRRKEGCFPQSHRCCAQDSKTSLFLPEERFSGVILFAAMSVFLAAKAITSCSVQTPLCTQQGR